MGFLIVVVLSAVVLYFVKKFVDFIKFIVADDVQVPTYKSVPDFNLCVRCGDSYPRPRGFPHYSTNEGAFHANARHSYCGKCRDILWKERNKK